MRTEFLFGVFAATGLVLAACVDKNDSELTADASADGGDDESEGSSDDGDVVDGDDDDDTGPAGDSSGDTGAPGDSESGADDMAFIDEPDTDGVNVECNVWDQDCNEGEKCMPWANDGGSSWNATKCSPLDPNPAQVGDPCTVEGSGVSGIDDCDRSTMCWNVDPETNMGVCVAFCDGSEANPVCEDPSTQCVIANEGVLILCLPNCHPTSTESCAEGQGCYPIDDGFACAPDASGEMGAYGDVCEFLNVCDPGLFCASPDAVPDCAGTGCCSPFCDLEDPDASASCPGAAGGQVCEEWYEPGQEPPGLGDVGACVIPA